MGATVPAKDADISGMYGRMDMRETAKYYEELYFYDGHKEISDKDQELFIQLLNANDAVGLCGVFEEEGYPIYCVSGFALTSLGYSFEELMEATGGKFLNLVYEKDKAAFAKEREQEIPKHHEFRVVDKEGNCMWVNSHRTRTVTADGRRLRIASIRVVDELRRRENQLLEAFSKEYRSILYLEEKGKNYRWIKKGGELSDAYESGSYEEIFQALERYRAVYVHSEDSDFQELIERVRRLSKEKMNDGRRYVTNYKMLAKDGKYRWNELQVIFSGNSEMDTGHIIITFRDVDDVTRKKLEENQIMANSLQKAEEIISLKNEFLSRMSHDMRTPLNGIIGMVEMANGNLEHAAKVKECHDKILVSCRNLVELINDVLDMQNLTSGKVEFNEENFDLVDMIQNGFSGIQRQVREGGLSYQVELEPFAHPCVRGSAKYIRGIFETVLSNAVRYNKEKGSVRLTGREISSSRSISIYEFVIEDSGIGMSEEFVKRIFEPFEQENNGARTEYQGSGLGMAIAKRIVEVIGGDISVESKLGEGTKVFLTLPLKTVKNISKGKPEGMADAKRLLAQESADKGRSREYALMHRESLAGKKALLAEDNEINMEIAKYILEDAGVIVQCAKNGQVAVEKFVDSAEGEIDFILMDILMPVMDGIEAAKKIRGLDREDAKKVPMIALSANALDADIKRSRMAGMDEHLTKPVERDMLIDTLAEYLVKE